MKIITTLKFQCANDFLVVKNTFCSNVPEGGVLDLATQKELMRLDVDIIPFPTKEHGNEAICTAVAEGKNGQVFFFNALKLIPSVPKSAALPS